MQRISAAEIYQGTLEGSAGLVCICLLLICQGFVVIFPSSRVCVERDVHIHICTH